MTDKPQQSRAEAIEAALTEIESVARLTVTADHTHCVMAINLITDRARAALALPATTPAQERRTGDALLLALDWLVAAHATSDEIGGPEFAEDLATIKDAAEAVRADRRRTTRTEEK